MGVCIGISGSSWYRPGTGFVSSGEFQLGNPLPRVVLGDLQGVSWAFRGRFNRIPNNA
jgi:hypothetical protein